MFLLILILLNCTCDLLKAFTIINGPMNVMVCSGISAEISCNFIGAPDPFSTRPDWRIIKRNNDGHVISNETVNATMIRSNKTDGLRFFTEVLNDNVSVRLLVGPVDNTYSNTSYQCILPINDTIIESDTAGTVTVIGTLSFPVLSYVSTLNEILVSWSPVDSDTVCGPVTYNITVMPSHGMIMMINDTVCSITGLNYDTNYTITVYASNNHTSGEPATVNVETKSFPDDSGSSNNSSNSSNSNSSSDSSNIGLIVGVAGGIVAIIIVIIIVVIICIAVCHRKKGETDYKKETFQSHALAESDQSQIYHECDQTNESKQSISKQVLSNEPKYAAAFKPADNKPSNEQHQVPLVEYAKVDKSKKNTPQQNSVPSGYEVNGSIVTANKEQIPTMEYAQVDKTVSQEEERPNAEYDDALVENQVPQISYAELQNIPTNVRGYAVDKDAAIVYTQVV